MNRGIALLVVVAVVVIAGGAGLAAAGPVETVAAQDDTETGDGSTEQNETTDITPGERLSGVIGVQSAEVSGEVESRAFEVGLSRAETAAGQADLVAQRLDRNERRIEEIEQRQRELRERRDAGELSQGAYAARMAETAARAETVRRDANRSAAVASEVPETVRADRGLSWERVERVNQRASELSGPEVAAVARGVAGTDVGGPMASERRGPPSGVPGDGADRPGRGDGPPGDAGDSPANRSEGGNMTAAHAGGSNASVDATRASGNASDETGSSEAAGARDGATDVSDRSGDSTGSNAQSEPADETDGITDGGADGIAHADGAGDGTADATTDTDDGGHGTDRSGHADNATDTDRLDDATALRVGVRAAFVGGFDPVNGNAVLDRLTGGDRTETTVALR